MPDRIATLDRSPRKWMHGAVNGLLDRAGLERRQTPPDLEPAFLALYERCRPYTMTSLERMYAVHRAAIYLQGRGLAGDVVECGVWRGGSSMMAALTLASVSGPERRLWLYDTFEGMAEPTAEDGAQARAEWAANQRDTVNEWCYSPLDEVRSNLLGTGLPAHRLELVMGKVEETIPGTLPETIALLRLDTDWYSSTRHELEHLFPLLEPGGVLIIDDYGHWQGARQAVDEYFAAHGVTMLLDRIDYTGRIGVKLP